MAGVLLHVTLAERAVGAAQLASREKSELTGPLSHDFRLGAVIVDLPYFERLWISGVRLLIGLGLHYEVWGNLLHLRSPAALARALFDRSESRAGNALALGFLTHLVVDLTFHEELERIVLEHADGRAELDTLHKRIEDEMDLHAHFALVNHSGMGTSYAREKLALVPHRSWMRQVAAAVEDVHAAAPSRRQLARWLFRLRTFGLICSSARAPWVQTAVRAYPELESRARALSEESIERAARMLTRGAAYLRGELDEESFFSAIPNRSLLDGGPAAPPRLGVPRWNQRDEDSSPG